MNIKDLPQGSVKPVVQNAQPLNIKNLPAGSVKPVQATTTPAAQPKGDGVLKSFAKSILSPFARTAVSAGRLAQAGVKAVEGDQQGAQETLQKPVNLPFMGETKPFSNEGYVPTEQLGAGLELGSYGIGGGGVKTVGKEIIKRTFGQAVKQGAKAGAVSGVTGGAGMELEKGGGAAEALKGGVIGGVTGAALGAAIPAVIGGVSNKLASRTAQKADELALLKGEPLPGTPPAPAPKVEIAGSTPEVAPQRPAPDARIATKQLNEAGEVVTDKTAKEAVRQGIDEADVALIKTGTPADKAKMQKMLSIRQSQLTNKRVTERATDVVGDTFLEKIAKPLENENKKARLQLEIVAKGLSGKRVDLTPAIEQFSGDLETAGIREMVGGKLNFKGSDFEGIPGAQTAIKNVYTRLLRLAKTGDAMEAHRIKRYIDEVVEYGKQTEGLSGRAQAILKKFRHNADTILDNTFPEYNKVNTAYSDTINELDKIGQAMGKTFKVNGTFADAKAGVVMRRILSNTQSRSDLLQLLESSQNVLKKYGIQMDEDIITQAQFADTLEKMIGSEAPTSFLGQIERGISGAEQAKSAAADLFTGQPIRAGIKAGKFLIDVTRGVNQENKLKALQELIKTTEIKPPSNFGKPKAPTGFNPGAVPETAPNQGFKYKSAVEAMNSPKMKAFFDELNAKKKASKVTKTSNNLYHTTSADNLESIAKNGLTSGNKPRFENVSGKGNISFSANEAGASYYGKQGDVMIRTKTSYKPTDLELDLLAGGEGTYISKNNVPPEMLEVKINGKWQSLKDYQSKQELVPEQAAPVVSKTPVKDIKVTSKTEIVAPKANLGKTAPKSEIAGYRIKEKPYGNNKNMDKGGFVELHDDKGNVVASADFAMRDDRAVLPQIAIADNFAHLKGKGIGTQLLDRVEKMAKERGAKQITAQVVLNPSFFEKRGYVGNPENSSMVKMLTEKPATKPTGAFSKKIESVDPIIQEAKKYKSFKEFEKSLDILYTDSPWRGEKHADADRLLKVFDGYKFHGTNATEAIKKEGFNTRGRGNYYNSGVYFSDSPDIAISYKGQKRSFGHSTDGVFAVNLKDFKIKEIDYKQFREINKGSGGEELVAKLKGQKFDGIHEPGGETLVWNVEKIKNPRTLEDMWKEANQKPKSVLGRKKTP